MSAPNRPGHRLVWPIPDAGARIPATWGELRQLFFAALTAEDAVGQGKDFRVEHILERGPRDYSVRVVEA